jgi:hypothetical protein
MAGLHPKLQLWGCSLEIVIPLDIVENTTYKPPTRISFCQENMRKWWWTSGFGVPPVLDNVSFYSSVSGSTHGLSMKVSPVISHLLSLSPFLTGPHCAGRCATTEEALDHGPRPCDPRSWRYTTEIHRNRQQFDAAEICWSSSHRVDRWSHLSVRQSSARLPVGCWAVDVHFSHTTVHKDLFYQIVQPGLCLRVRSIPDNRTAKNMMIVQSWARYHH